MMDGFLKSRVGVIDDGIEGGAARFIDARKRCRSIT
jgi:hypothetical protein